MPGIEVERVFNEELLRSELKDFICIFCNDLVNPSDALQTPCGHIFCSTCILHSLKVSGPNCPVDRSEIQKHQLLPLKDSNKVVYRMLGRTLIRCINHMEGCDWRGELSEDASHLYNCKHLSEKCIKCEQKEKDMSKAKELITGFEKLVEIYEKKVVDYESKMVNYEEKIQFYEKLIASSPFKDYLASTSQASAPQPNQQMKQSLVVDKAESSRPKLVPPPWDGGIIITTLPGHTDYINSMVMSPDGRLFSASWDGTIRVWQTYPTRTCIATLTGHRGSVNSITLARDGTLYSCGDDKTIRAWRNNTCVEVLETGNLLSRVPVRLAIAGDALFVGYYQGGICVFEGGKKVATLREQGRGAAYMDLVAGKDGALYFSGGVDKSIIVYRGGAVVDTLMGHKGDIYSLALSEDGVLYSLGTDDVIKVWKEGMCLATLSGLNAKGDLLVGLDGVMYCGSSKEPVVRAWRGDKCVGVLQGHNDSVVALAMGPDGVLYSGDARGNIKAWKGTVS